MTCFKTRKTSMRDSKRCNMQSVNQNFYNFDICGGPNFVPEKCLKEFSITCLICFWSILFLIEMSQNFNCEQFESGSNLQFDTWLEFSKRNEESLSLFNHNFEPDRTEIRFIKIAFACQIQQVILNSFEYFPWRKIGPRHNRWLNFFWHMCYPSSIVRILNHKIRILF